MRASILICAVLLTVSTLPAQHEYTPGDVQDGQRLFGASCAQCHGPEGDAVPGVDLGHGKFKRASSDGDLLLIIEKGIPGTAMPPANFNDFQAGTIVAYLRSMAATVASGPSIPGDATRGKALFEGKGNCLNCHRVKGRGSRLGPELTDIGTLRRAVQLEQSILEPDAEILPQNRFLRVVTKDGATVTGRLLNQDAWTIQLFDSKERLVTFEKTSVREYAFIDKSPMPSYRGKLSTQELADLVGYLTSLKGIEAK
jgi:putative heme-binding domain-containing protein